jgi:hypothetical protein
VSYRIEPNTPLASPTRAFTLPEAFDLRFYYRHPQALAIDSATVRLTVADVKGRRRCRSGFKTSMVRSLEASSSTLNRLGGLQVALGESMQYALLEDGTIVS